MTSLEKKSLIFLQPSPQIQPAGFLNPTHVVLAERCRTTELFKASSLAFASYCCFKLTATTHNAVQTSLAETLDGAPQDLAEVMNPRDSRRTRSSRSSFNAHTQAIIRSDPVPHSSQRGVRTSVTRYRDGVLHGIFSLSQACCSTTTKYMACLLPLPAQRSLLGYSPCLGIHSVS